MSSGRKQEKHYFLCVWVIKGRKVMLNSRLLKEKGCKLQKNKWIGRALNNVFLVPQSTEASNVRSRPAWTQLFTLNVKVNTSCQVSRESSRLFPRIPWGQSLALNISWPSRSPNNMRQMKIFTHRMCHFLAPWAQIPYLVLDWRSKGKISRFVFIT